MASTTQQRPALRRDAERNRRRLLAAAREVFGEVGIEASLEEIARRADVGIGTLYRRFPSRTALIEALFEDKAREFARASEVAMTDDDAWQGLAGLIEHICEMQAADRGFTDVLTASFPAAPELQACMTRARRNIEKLVLRARAEGTLRKDFVSADIFWIMIANAAYLQATRGIAESAWRRYVELILDALRSPPSGILPPAPTKQQIEQAVERIGRSATGC